MRGGGQTLVDLLGSGGKRRALGGGGGGGTHLAGKGENGEKAAGPETGILL